MSKFNFELEESNKDYESYKVSRDGAHLATVYVYKQQDGKFHHQASNTPFNSADDALNDFVKTL